MTANVRPGFSIERMTRLVKSVVSRMALDLDGLTVLTEAASGAYAVTPVIAALAGARSVQALGRDSCYGTYADTVRQVEALANSSGVGGRIQFSDTLGLDILACADVVTNSGFLRPLDAVRIGQMHAGAVIPLMYEAWERRPSDVDVAACRGRGVRVAGTNEHHPKADVFSYLGCIAVRQMHDAGFSCLGNRILLVCDNGFAPFIVRGLVGAGAIVDTVVSAGITLKGDYDVVMVATSPGPCIPSRADSIGWRRCGASAVVHFWGTLDLNVLRDSELAVWPVQPVKNGHMGILLSDTGPESIVALQGAGLKVGEILARGCHRYSHEWNMLVQDVV